MVNFPISYYALIQLKKLHLVRDYCHLKLLWVFTTYFLLSLISLVFSWQTNYWFSPLYTLLVVYLGFISSLVINDFISRKYYWYKVRLHQRNNPKIALSWFSFVIYYLLMIILGLSGFIIVTVINFVTNLPIFSNVFSIVGVFVASLTHLGFVLINLICPISVSFFLKLN